MIHQIAYVIDKRAIGWHDSYYAGYCRYEETKNIKTNKDTDSHVIYFHGLFEKAIQIYYITTNKPNEIDLINIVFKPQMGLFYQSLYIYLFNENQEN